MGKNELNFYRVIQNEGGKGGTGKYCPFRGSIESVRDCFENIRARPM